MKLAFCLFNYFPYGGLQRDFMRIAKACQARGHEIHVYTMKWEGEQPADFQIHLIPVKAWTNHGRSGAFAEKIGQIRKQASYDLIIGFNKMPYLDLYYAADVCYQARVKEQRPWFYRVLPRYQQLKKLEEAVFAEASQTKIMLIADKQQPIFMAYYQTPLERFYLLPPGIAKDRMAPNNAAEVRQAFRQNLNIAPHEHLLLMVGSGFKTKGVDRSIRALAALPADLRMPSHLLIVGDDHALPFQALAKELGVSDRVHFLGGRPDVPQFLLAADLLLHPAYHENTGTVLLEALVSGLPVLTVDVCGYAHYIIEAQAGKVLSSPFRQSAFNALLQDMLLSSQRDQWHANALAFSKVADIYSLPEKAADIIEAQIKQEAQAFHLSFEDFMQLKGQAFRALEGRATQKVMIQDQAYFIKQHRGIGWKEIIKNLLQLRLPILGAKNEWRALQLLAALKVPVAKVYAYGKKGMNPAKQQSFILMQALEPSISLEDLVKVQPLKFAFKQNLIKEVAKMTRIMHQAGINHRDLYICHFLLDQSQEDVKLYLIDLHRAEIRTKVPKRWLIKDLAALYFSSKDSGLSQRDLYRFMKLYTGLSLRDIQTRDARFWNKVKKRGEHLYREHS